MIPHVAASLYMAPLMAFVVWRRVRRTFGWQPVKRGRMTARIGVFALLGCLVASTAIVPHYRPLLLEGMLGGVLCGTLLGLIGLRLTRFQRDGAGADTYLPNPWIGALLTALLVGRVAWRMLVAWPQQHVEHAVSGSPAIGNSPLTLAMFGLLVGYYVCYFAGLLVHHRRFEQSQATLATPAR